MFKEYVSNKCHGCLEIISKCSKFHGRRNWDETGRKNSGGVLFETESKLGRGWASVYLKLGSGLQHVANLLELNYLCTKTNHKADNYILKIVGIKMEAYLIS